MNIESRVAPLVDASRHSHVIRFSCDTVSQAREKVRTELEKWTGPGMFADHLGADRFIFMRTPALLHLVDKSPDGLWQWFKDTNRTSDNLLTAHELRKGLATNLEGTNLFSTCTLPVGWAESAVGLEEYTSCSCHGCRAVQRLLTDGGPFSKKVLSFKDFKAGRRQPSSRRAGAL